MLRANNHPNVLPVALLVLLTATIFALGSCRPHATIVSTHTTDSTSTESTITFRDTTVVVPSDAAALEIGADLESIQHLLEELKARPLTVRGERNASLVLRNNEGRLHIESRCDSVAMVLDSVIRLVKTRTYELHQVQEQLAVRDREDRFRVPGWAWGIALATISVTACVALLLFLVKRTFK